jgi:hypothetical protein
VETARQFAYCQQSDQLLAKISTNKLKCNKIVNNFGIRLANVIDEDLTTFK